ncbi:MAG: hypothetical protein M3069_31360 [Chloroflexota bacterium]|nr:hypothetical protein [Chloroflexota bacterium]
MSPKLSSSLAALSGIVGVLVLAIYFSQPLPIPVNTEPVAAFTAFGNRYHNEIMVGAWIQAIGTLLVSIFFLELVHLAGAATRLSGLMTVFSAGALWVVGLVEVVASMAIAQAAGDGHVEGAAAAFDLTGVFIHVIPIGPAGAVYLALGAVLLGARVLPRVFGFLALALGASFEIAGFVGLFDPTNPQLSITILLILQEVWVLAAAIIVLVRTVRSTTVDSGLRSAQSTR